MRRRCLLGCFLIPFIFFLSTSAWGSLVEIESPSRIQNIVIYTDRAMIKKEAAFPVKKGENIIKILGITPNLIDESVQVSFGEKSAPRVLDVKIEQTFLQKRNLEKVQQLQSRLDSLNELVKTHMDEIAVINNSIDFLKKVVPFPQNQKVTPSEVEEHIKFVEKALSGNHEKTLKIENKLRKLNEEKKAVENELKNLSSIRDRSKNLVITLLSPADQKEIKLQFTYVVTGAGWVPQYDVRADSKSEKIEVDCFAMIKQSTGEDWKDAAVEISTAKPSVQGTPPELSAWHVDIYQPKPIPLPSPSRFPMERQEGRLSKSMEAVEDAAKPFEEPQLKEEMTSLTFILPRTVTVPSDNQPHRVLIASSNPEAKMRYYAVPKLSRYAYLRANLKNPFPFPLLPSRMNIFLDDKFVSNASLGKTILPMEELYLSLGVDEGIKMERKLQKKFTESAGLLSKNIRVNYEYAIDITNGKNREVTIDLNDQFPLSRNEQIKVELESPGKDEARISAEGIIAWNLKMNPGEKKNLKIKFKVEHSKDLKITGME
ncbi:MAG: mucoidy inhibitor MuiA family protein [Syntrophaceae bacterium]|nr:mucoidy inhibitor MuiA family protein [Syntrophaceae bacterium]